jgi:hypothetical protein
MRQWPLFAPGILLVGAIAISLGSSRVAHAQADHYWTESYGTEATLLGGVVIGGCEDLSATFYNPGALGLIDQPAFILSAHVWERQSFTVKDAGPNSEDLSATSIHGVPGFVGGSFEFSWLGSSRLCYSILSRQQTDVRLVARLSREGDGSGPSGSRGGEVVMEKDVSDTWGGLSWATSSGNRLGFGATLYGAVRSDRERRQAVAARTDSPTGQASAIRIAESEASDGRLLLKTGLQYTAPRWRAGLTITTPSLHVFGSGSSWLFRSTNGYDGNGDGAPDSVVAVSHQDDLESRFKTPWAIGVGGAVDIGRTTILLSAENYGAIDSYSLIDTSPVTASDGEVIPNSVRRSAESVFNWGVGVREDLGDSILVYASFVTDRNATPGGDVTGQLAPPWDLYIVSGGTKFTVGKFDLVLGLSWAFGSTQLRSLTEPIEINGTEPEPLEAATSRLRALFAFSVGI